jgi:hypothetical protein
MITPSMTPRRPPRVALTRDPIGDGCLDGMRLLDEASVSLAALETGGRQQPISSVRIGRVGVLDRLLVPPTDRSCRVADIRNR